MNPKIYILHGWTYENGKWQPFTDALSRAGIRTRILTIPGLTAPIDHPWTIEDYVVWLDLIISREKQPVILLGHSNGGRIAMWYALTHPRKIRRLILVDSAGIYHNNLIIRLKRSVFKVLAKTGKFLTANQVFRRALYAFTGESDYRDATPVMRQTMANLLESDSRLSPELIRVPVTIIWGRNDRITPLSDGQNLAARIPRAELHVIGGAGHGPQYSHVEESVKLVEYTTL